MKYFIFLIFTLFLLSSCAKLDKAGYEIGDGLGMKILGEEEEVDTFCIREAKKLEPDQVSLLYIGHNWYLKEFFFTNDYEDKSVSIRYDAGEKEGENVLYYYPRNLLENNYVSFREEIIRDDVIQGFFTFKLKLILQNTSQEQLINDTLYGNDIHSQVFDVVDAKYVDCFYP